MEKNNAWRYVAFCQDTCPNNELHYRENCGMKVTCATCFTEGAKALGITLPTWAEIEDLYFAIKAETDNMRPGSTFCPARYSKYHCTATNSNYCKECNDRLFELIEKPNLVPKNYMKRRIFERG